MAPTQDAAKSLRTTLWRIRHAGANLVLARDDRLRLYPGVTVDVADLTDLAKRLIHQPDPGSLARLSLLIECVELLPDWEDEWVVADRERYRLLRLEALERAASALMERCHLGDALIAALAAVQAEPLRESARRLVVQVQIAQGNVAEAIHSYREYQSLLRRELGLEPSPLMDQLIQPLGSPMIAARRSHDLQLAGGMGPERHRRPRPADGRHAVAVVRVEVRDGTPGDLLIELIEVGRERDRLLGRATEYGRCLPCARGVAEGAFAVGGS